MEMQAFPLLSAWRFLGEYIDENVVEELRMRMSIGQALGIVTAGDRRRAAERNGLRRGKKLGAQKEREKNAAREARIAEYLRSIGVPAEKVDAALAIKWQNREIGDWTPGKHWV